MLHRQQSRDCAKTCLLLTPAWRCLELALAQQCLDPSPADLQSRMLQSSALQRQHTHDTTSSTAHSVMQNKGCYMCRWPRQPAS